MAEITTIARPYAHAIFKLARENQALDAWADMLGLLAVIATDPDMRRMIDSPRISSDKLANLVIDICGDQLSTDAQNFVKVLAENGRMMALAEIHHLYQTLKSEAEGAIQAQLITAFPATEAQKTAVLEALKKRFGRDIELECRTDATLVGGAVIRAGDMVIDGSVSGKLDKLAAALSH